MISNIKSLLNKMLGRKSLLEQLRENGLKHGKNFFINTGCIIDYSHCWLIEIGDDVTLASRVHILVHDASTKGHLGFTRIAQVKIGNNVFIGAGSIIMPGVTIGNNVIVGAGSIVTKDIADDMVVAGSPAKVLTTIPEYLAKQKSKFNSENCFDESYTLRGGITETKKIEMLKVLAGCKEGFVE